MEQSGARFLALLDVAQHSVELRFGDLRALVSVFMEGIANLCCELLGSLGKLFKELVVDGVLYADSRC